ncbi:MAG: sialidase family protein [Eubacteriales bacterium]|nr:sialidase family protein [Eubacteriales bacterium]
MKLLGIETLFRDENYVAFPNLATLKDGTVICAFRHAKERQKEYGRVTHVDPTAKDVFIISNDGGKSFDKTLHEIINDGMSEQDPCLNVLSDGRIIVTYFRWELVSIGKGKARWGAAFEKFGRQLAGKYDCFEYGAACSISDDNGKTWQHMTPIIMDGWQGKGAVRGNITELPDGTLLLPLYGAKSITELSRAVLMRSTDRGETWEEYSLMAFDEECKKNFLEPNMYRTESGRLIGLYRTQTDYLAPGVDFEETYLNLHISISEDDGKTFGEVIEIPNCWCSSPVHALRLKSGKVLLTYGYRREPFGIRARLCNAELTDIAEAEEIIITEGAINGDLGYPCSLQLADGEILVSYYISADDGIRTIDVARLRED